MSLLRRGVESRAIESVPWDQGGSPVLSGSVESALRLIPLYAATAGIADDVAVMPWHGYRRSERLASQPAILREPGVGPITAIAWRTQAVMSLLLRGFAFGLIVAVDRLGFPSKIAWVHPDKVDIDESGDLPVFRVSGRVIDYAEMVYIPAAVLPGSVVGLSPVSLFRLQMSKGLAADRYAADFFDRGIMPPGVLRNSKKILAPGEADAVKGRFKASVAGRDIFVTGNDWEWSALGVPADDAAFLDAIRATATQIAAIYRVAPEDIGGTTGESMTYKTLEMNELRRNRRALLPWVRRLEEALTALLPAGQYVRANMDALARTDLLTRMRSHEIGLRIGLETNDEGRALEDKPPLTDAERQEWQEMYARLYARTDSGATEGANDDA